MSTTNTHGVQKPHRSQRLRHASRQFGMTPTGNYRFRFPRTCIRNYLDCAGIRRVRRPSKNLINWVMEALISRYYRLASALADHGKREIVQHRDILHLQKIGLLPTVY